MKRISSSPDRTEMGPEMGLLKGMLAGAGIPSAVGNEQMSQLIPAVPFSAELWVVNDEDYENALALCEAWRHPSPGVKAAWTCLGCGEEIEGQFGACWNCGTEPVLPRPCGGQPLPAPAHVIICSELLNDKIRVHYRCIRPWATEDERGIAEVPWEAIPALPGPPPMEQGGGVWREVWDESVDVPAFDVTIFFRFARWQETDDCRMEALIGGPYKGTLAPLDQASRKASVGPVNRL
jgi:hypothetical protein